MLQQKLSYYKQNYLLREIKEVHKDMINFSSNDYLGLSQNEAVKQAVIQGVKLYGFGSGSSSLISGYFPQPVSLKRNLHNY